MGSERIKTDIGEMKTNKIQISFKGLNFTNTRTSDILTNNLVNPANTLIFWFSDDKDKIPVKAYYLMDKYAVSWVIKSVSK
jgi:hypothetical protein